MMVFGSTTNTWKRQILVSMSNLTWLQAAVRKYEFGIIVAGFRPRVDQQEYRGLPLLSNGYSCALIRSMVQEICFIEVDKCCWNSVLDSLEDLTISIFWSSFEIKTPETLNTKHVDIFLRFPMNICVCQADKPSNGYGHWKIARGKILMEIKKHIEFLKTEKDLVRERKQDNRLNEKRALWPFPVGLHAETEMRNPSAVDSP
jgi:hypothetical protein